jgi:multiple antibiotic resistance protein
VSEIVNTALLVFAGLFPVVNPLGNAPVFLSLTRRCTGQERHTLAGRVAVNGFLLLLGSLLIGSHILTFFGLTLPVVRVAGGLVIAATGWKLLTSGEEPEDLRTAQSATQERAALPDSFYPLTMPLTVGPGSITVAITFGSRRPVAPDSLSHLVMLAGAAIAGLLAIAVTVYASYRFASDVSARLGATGTRVLTRLSAFILLCIGIEIMWSGVRALLTEAGF